MVLNEAYSETVWKIHSTDTLLKMVHHWVLELLRKLIACSRCSLIIDGTMQEKWWWGGVGGESVPSSPPLPLSSSLFFLCSLTSCWLPLSERLEQARKLRTLRITQYSILLPARIWGLLNHLWSCIKLLTWQSQFDKLLEIIMYNVRFTLCAN